MLQMRARGDTISHLGIRKRSFAGDATAPAVIAPSRVHVRVYLASVIVAVEVDEKGLPARESVARRFRLGEAGRAPSSLRE